MRDVSVHKRVDMPLDEKEISRQIKQIKGAENTVYETVMERVYDAVRDNMRNWVHQMGPAMREDDDG